MRRIDIVGHHCSNTGHLVGSDAGASTGTAHNYPSLDPSIDYRTSDRFSEVRIVDRLFRVCPEVDDSEVSSSQMVPDRFF